MYRKFFLVIATVIAAVTLLSPTHIALAANQVVTNCTNDTALRSALTTMQSSGGGTLTFNCGTATILFSSVLPSIVSGNTATGAGGRLDYYNGNNVSLDRVTSSGNSADTADGNLSDDNSCNAYFNKAHD